jgi:broad specificity phosphatase PhoE
MATTTVVHLLRHGEVYNPTGVLYGRLPDFHLSELGRKMAIRAAEALAGADVALVTASPLERAQETAQPIAESHKLAIGTDADLIEADNVFEGQKVSPESLLTSPRAWTRLTNPFRPSWGEPYVDLAARMRGAVDRARQAAAGREAVLVSHQLPIWIARLDMEGRRFVHDPRKRQCTLASLTSLHFEDDALVAVVYSEPSADLLPQSTNATGA